MTFLNYIIQYILLVFYINSVECLIGKKVFLIDIPMVKAINRSAIKKVLDAYWHLVGLYVIMYRYMELTPIHMNTVSTIAYISNTV
jgi:hypothetical protein